MKYDEITSHILDGGENETTQAHGMGCVKPFAYTVEKVVTALEKLGYGIREKVGHVTDDFAGLAIQFYMPSKIDKEETMVSITIRLNTPDPNPMEDVSFTHDLVE